MDQDRIVRRVKIATCKKCGSALLQKTAIMVDIRVSDINGTRIEHMNQGRGFVCSNDRCSEIILLG